jgi:UDP-N-acetylmuramate--alanine ligase
VIRSVAVPEDDPQVLEARSRGIPVLKYGQALARLAPASRQLAVAGTHGKTTAAWMLWHALEGIGEELNAPVSAALIGGISRRLETSALAGNEGGWFCLEACEYDRTFLNLAPRGALITNVEPEHLDYFGTLEALHAAFARFASAVHENGLMVLGPEVPEEVELGARCTVWRLGRELGIDLLDERRGCFRFRLRGPGWATPEIRLQVPGHFNVDNAALALALAVGITDRHAGSLELSTMGRAVAKGVESFEGVSRRFERWGTDEDVAVVHDYAHHPTEVRVTLEAARRTYPRVPLHVLFQPHQFSRTARFLHEFAESLRSVDRVVVADVYGARSHLEDAHPVGARELVTELKARDVDAVEGGGLSSAVDRFVQGLPQRAAAFVLGAGDVELVRDELLHELALRGAASGRAGS